MKQINSFFRPILLAFMLFGFKSNAQIASPPTVSGDLTVCNLSSAVLDATDPTFTPGATFIWYTKNILGVYTPIDTVDQIVLGPLVLTGNYGVATYNPSNNDLSAKTDFTITVNTLDVFADTPIAVPEDATVCNGGTTNFNAVSPLGGTSFRWYDAPVNGKLLFTGNPYNSGPLTVAPTLYVSSIDNAGCESPRVAVIQPIVLGPLTLPITGASKTTMCSGDSVKFYTTNKAATDTVHWYTSLLGGSAVAKGDTLELTEKNTGGASLTVTYYAEFEDQNGCRSLRFPASVVVLPALDVALVDNPIQVICDGQSATFNASSLLGGASFKWYDAFVGGNEIHAGASFNTGSVSNTSGANVVVQFFVSVLDPSTGCESIRTPVTLTIVPALDFPFVSVSPQTACEGDSVEFTATSLLGGAEYRWYDAFAGGNFLDTGAVFNTGPLPNPGPNSVTNNFYVEVVDTNGCASARNVGVAIALPAVGVATYEPLLPTICSGDSVLFTASGLPNDFANYNWYDSPSATVPVKSGDTFNTGPIVNSTSTNLLTTYYLEGVDTNGCASIRTPITVTTLIALDLPVVANSPAIICSGDSVTFTASSLLGSAVDFHWFDAAFGGTQIGQGADFKTGPLTNEDPANTVQTFWVEVEDTSGCRSLRMPAMVTIRPALDLPVVTPPVQVICSGDTAVFTATSVLGTHQEFYWYDALVGGNLIFTGDTFSTNALSNSSNNNVSLTVYVEFADTAGCRSLRAPATIVVAPAVDLPIVDNPAQVICNGDEATFVATSLLGGSDFAWYDAFTGGNLLHEGDTFRTGPLTNPNQIDVLRLYYVEVLDSNGCSSVRMPVAVTLRPNLDLPLVLPPVQTVCSGDSATFIASSVGNLIGMDVSFHWYDVPTGGTEIFEGDTFVTPPVVNESGTNFTQEFWVEVADSNNCRSLRLPVSAIILPALDVPVVTPLTQVICASDSAEFIASSLLGSAQEFYWYDSIVSGNEIFVGDTFNTGGIANDGSGDLVKMFYVELEDTAGCRSVRVPVTLVIRPSLSVPVVTPPLSIVCEGDSVELVATALFDGEFRWYDSLSGGTLLHVGDTFISGPLSNVSGTDLDTLFYVEAIDTAGCVGLVRTFGTVIIRPAINLAIVSPLVDTICSGGEAEFVATAAVPGTVKFFWYEDSLGGTAVFEGDTFRTSINSNGSTANFQETYYVEVEDSTGCRSVRTPATIVVTPGLDAPMVDPPLQRICSGTTATIVASSLDDTGSDYFWYDSSTGVTPIFQGDTFVTDTLNNITGSDAAFTFFVELKDTTGEGCVSQRVSATVIVSPSPDTPIIENPSNTICNGDSVTFIASSSASVPGAIYWYDTMDSENEIFVGDTFNTGALFNTGTATTMHDFYAEFRDSSGCRSFRAAGFVSIQPFLDAPTADPMNQTICAGGDAPVKGNSASPSVETFNWYNVQSGGTPFDTGDSIVIRDIQNNTSSTQVFTYYVESVDSAGCTSARTPFTVTVQAPSAKPTVDPVDPTICTGSSVSLTANSDFGDEGTYRWYDEASDNTPIFVGRTYTTPTYYNFDGALQQHDFYVQVEDTIGCSSGLKLVVVTVEPNGDDVLGQQLNNPTCHGSQATIKAISDAGYTDFKWFKRSTDTIPFFSGETLVTGPLFADTTVFLSSYQTSGCSSARFPVNIRTQEIKVVGKPVINCVDYNDGETVGFRWSAVVNAEFYQVSTDNGLSWKAANGPNGLEHTVKRTSDDQEFASLIVRAGQTPTTCSDQYGPNSEQIACSFGEFISDDDPFNAFSPNGDGVNDVWYIQDGLEDFKDNEVTVFNRWGQEVFKTKGYDNQNNVFDGDGQEDGAYFFVIKIPSINKKKTGYVMIIR